MVIIVAVIYGKSRNPLMRAITCSLEAAFTYLLLPFRFDGMRFDKTGSVSELIAMGYCTLHKTRQLVDNCQRRYHKIGK